tara:strand:+ start:108 stop:269 length:162 start_codon:yes stop_codon:yes gene_type:complete
MKLTKKEIKQIIKEELEQVMNEVELEEQEALQEEADASAKQELIDAMSVPMTK